MGVNSYAEIFTTVIGWHLYNVVWDVLASTGIVYLPFLGILLEHWRTAFVDGEEMGLTTVPAPGAGLRADRRSEAGMPRLDKEPRVAVGRGREEHDAAVVRSTRTLPTTQRAGDRPPQACRTDDEDGARLEILNRDDEIAVPQPCRARVHLRSAPLPPGELTIEPFESGDEIVRGHVRTVCQL